MSVCNQPHSPRLRCDAFPGPESTRNATQWILSLMEGSVLLKAIRKRVIQAFNASDGGKSSAKRWGCPIPRCAGTSPRACRHQLTEKCPLDIFPGARCHCGGEAFGRAAPQPVLPHCGGEAFGRAAPQQVIPHCGGEAFGRAVPQPVLPHRSGEVARRADRAPLSWH